ncbi:Hypothetical predicted protein [Cloeon dipterum]|uniref:Uncharacterized protein n=1 Tax=Cloeon dipterum TaxID=197152 RepID=A0A8S1CMD4_9INSE|nr:Hypothetical predicted protein [Cloeon dipterum]
MGISRLPFGHWSVEAAKLTIICIICIGPGNITRNCPQVAPVTGNDENVAEYRLMSSKVAASLRSFDIGHLCFAALYRLLVYAIRRLRGKSESGRRPASLALF